MIRSIVVGLTVALGVTVAIAQSDPIAQRKTLMKANGAATRTGSQMVKGEVPFDLAKAKEILATYAKTAATAHEYFPDNSKTGGDTTAAPKIWEDQAAFKARFDQWGKQIDEASAKVTDLESFKAAFGTVTQACQSCHQTYRIQKS